MAADVSEVVWVAPCQIASIHGDPHLQTPNSVYTQSINHSQNILGSDFPEPDMINAIVDLYLFSDSELPSDNHIWLIGGCCSWVHLYLFPIICGR